MPAADAPRVRGHIAFTQAEGFGKARAGRPAIIHFTLEKAPDWDSRITPHARMALEVALMALEGYNRKASPCLFRAISRFFQMAPASVRIVPLVLSMSKI